VDQAQKKEAEMLEGSRDDPTQQKDCRCPEKEKGCELSDQKNP